MVFNSMLHTPVSTALPTKQCGSLTFQAFLCMAVLKVVSLSSITFILPADVGLAKNVEALTSRSTTSAAFSAIITELKGRV